MNAAISAADGGDTTNIALSFAGGFAAGFLPAIMPGGIYVGALIAGACSSASDYHTQKNDDIPGVNFWQVTIKGVVTASLTAMFGEAGSAWSNSIVKTWLTSTGGQGVPKILIDITTSRITGLVATTFDCGMSTLTTFNSRDSG